MTVAVSDVEWKSIPVVLPLSRYVAAHALKQQIQDESLKANNRFHAATILAWVRRCAASDPIPIACLKNKDARVLHMPGELFVEYQLSAQRLRFELLVAMADYSDYATGYIGTEIGYTQGVCETSPRARGSLLPLKTY